MATKKEFTAWVREFEDCIQKTYGGDSREMGLSHEDLNRFHDSGETPQSAVDFYGEKHGLQRLHDFPNDRPLKTQRARSLR